MSCPSWKEAIAWKAGGNLSPAEGAALERHLQSCEACREFSGEMEESQEVIRRFHERALADASFARVRSGVLERLAAEKASHFPRSLSLDSPGTPRLAARWRTLAAGLIVALSFWQMQSSHAPEDEPDLERPHRVVPSPVAQPDLSEAPFVSMSPKEVKPRVPRRAATEGTAAETILTKTTPRRERFRRWSPVELTRGELTGSLESLDASIVVLPASNALPEPSPSLVVLPAPVASSPAEPFLRRVAEGESYTIFWLEEPKDPLKEKEDASTKVL